MRAVRAEKAYWGNEHGSSPRQLGVIFGTVLVLFITP